MSQVRFHEASCATRRLSLWSGERAGGGNLYANKLAKHGYVTLAFDPSYNGYSRGEPRHVSSGVKTATTTIPPPSSQLSRPSLMNFPELAHPDWIEAEVLTVVGEQTATHALSEAIHERLTTKKQLLVVPGAGHVDLYHRKDIIPFEEISTFLDKTLG